MIILGANQLTYSYFIPLHSEKQIIFSKNDRPKTGHSNNDHYLSTKTSKNQCSKVNNSFSFQQPEQPVQKEKHKEAIISVLDHSKLKNEQKPALVTCGAVSKNKEYLHWNTGLSEEGDKPAKIESLIQQLLEKAIKIH